MGAADQIEYENIGGKGGTIGLAKYAEKYGNDPNTLLMGGMVMVGAVALQKPRRGHEPHPAPLPGSPAITWWQR